MLYLVSILLLGLGFVLLVRGIRHAVKNLPYPPSRFGKPITSRKGIIAVSILHLVAGIAFGFLGTDVVYGQIFKTPGVATGCIERSEDVGFSKGGAYSDYDTSCGQFHLSGSEVSLTAGAAYNFNYDRVPNLFPLPGSTNEVTRIERINTVSQPPAVAGN